MEYKRALVDTFCRHNYEIVTPFAVETRGERGADRVPSGPALAMTRDAPQLIPVCPRSLPVPPSVSISLMPSSSQPGPDRLLCSVMDFYPAQIQVRWFQGQQELSEHVVATDVVANGDWTYQLLVLLETPPRRGLSYTCQVEHVSLEQPFGFQTCFLH
uniref:Ig-like domain-containing protein n=1 Tax=Ficedula albicollis TaxID=59894 RepID=U3JYQ6_FICAL